MRHKVSPSILAIIQLGPLSGRERTPFSNRLGSKFKHFLLRGVFNTLAGAPFRVQADQKRVSAIASPVAGELWATENPNSVAPTNEKISPSWAMYQLNALA
jgi:hypothetical protein